MPGELIFDMPREQYDRIDAVNFSTLKHMARSPAHYLRAVRERDADTDARKVGRAVHVAVLEPERFNASTAVWDAGVRRGKKWDKFCEKHEGVEILTAREAKQIADIQQAVRSDAIASKYVTNGRAEVTMLWEYATESGAIIKCKGRPDFGTNGGALVDLKTTRNASPEGFGKEVWRYSYHVQAAYYADGYYYATGKRLPFYFVAVESESPHVVQVYRVPDVVLELGRETYRNLLERLAHCRATSRWPGYVDGEAELELPRWAVDFADDDDVSDIGLVFNDEEQAEVA